MAIESGLVKWRFAHKLTRSRTGTRKRIIVPLEGNLAAFFSFGFRVIRGHKITSFLRRYFDLSRMIIIKNLA